MQSWGLTRSKTQRAPALLHHLLSKRAKRQPGAACAASRKWVPRTKIARQLFGQSMPAGRLLTVPWPTSVTKATSRCTNALDPDAKTHATAATASTLVRKRTLNRIVTEIVPREDTPHWYFRVVFRLPASPRARRRLAWSAGAGALLVAGLAVALLIPSREQPAGAPSIDEGPAQLAIQTHGKISRSDRHAIDALLDRFFPAAVERKDMAKAWRLAGPEMKAASSLADFRRGVAPVPRYPAHERNYHHWQAIDVEKDAVILDVLVHPKNAYAIGAWVFSVQVVKHKGAWLVNRIYTAAVMNPATRPATETHELGPADYAAPPSGGTSRGKAPRPATAIGKKGLIPGLIIVGLILLIPLGIGLVVLYRGWRWRKLTRSNPRNTLPELPSSYRKTQEDDHELATRP
jgi:hypothetical protein